MKSALEIEFGGLVLFGYLLNNRLTIKVMKEEIQDYVL